MQNPVDKVKSFYDASYSIQGFDAQRRFPNEELCRFMGRNYFHLSKNKRKLISILDVGCGTGANLWMLAREGFNAYGLDLSAEAIDLCERMVADYGASAKLSVGSMTKLQNLTCSLDCIIDVFSSNCLTSSQGKFFLKEVFRTLKNDGKFFSYFPSSNSHAWLKADDCDRIDKNTLTGINRKESPFYGYSSTFRFLSPEQYLELLEDVGFSVSYLENVSRTYGGGQEYFEFTVVEAKKN